MSEATAVVMNNNEQSEAPVSTTVVESSTEPVESGSNKSKSPRGRKSKSTTKVSEPCETPGAPPQEEVEADGSVNGPITVSTTGAPSTATMLEEQSEQPDHTDAPGQELPSLVPKAVEQQVTVGKPVEAEVVEPFAEETKPTAAEEGTPAQAGESETDESEAGESVGTLCKVPVKDIRVGKRHRRDYGDLKAFAANIAENGLLQPIGLTVEHVGEPLDSGYKFKLVFGERRLKAVNILGHETILARVFSFTNPVRCEAIENQERKDFTVTERVDLAKAMQESFGERRGGNHKGQEIGDCLVGRSDVIASEQAGFGNRETYRQAKLVVEHGIDELQQAMDRGEVSISRAAQIAKEERESQLKLLEETRKKRPGAGSAEDLQAISEQCERLTRRIDAAVKARRDPTSAAKPQVSADISARFRATVEALQRLQSATAEPPRNATRKPARVSTKSREATPQNEESVIGETGAEVERSANMLRP